jgi:hypothetical protein
MGVGDLPRLIGPDWFERKGIGEALEGCLVPLYCGVFPWLLGVQGDCILSLLVPRCVFSVFITLGCWGNTAVGQIEVESGYSIRYSE